jgi:hypothetical protein
MIAYKPSGSDEDLQPRDSSFAEMTASKAVLESVKNDFVHRSSTQ